MSKKVYIKTFGCQMNEHDSGRLKDLLSGAGYGICQTEQDADVIIFNTCSVRKHAEDRVYGKVGSLQKLKLKTNVKTNFSGSVEYQTCDDKKCLPPKTVNFSVAIK